MADQNAKSVQCTEEDQAAIAAAAETLRWTIPQVVALLTQALPALMDGEETVEQRRARMLGKLSSGSTGVRQVSNRSRNTVGQVSDSGPGLVEVAS